MREFVWILEVRWWKSDSVMSNAKWFYRSKMNEIFWYERLWDSDLEVEGWMLRLIDEWWKLRADLGDEAIESPWWSGGLKVI